MRVPKTLGPREGRKELRRPSVPYLLTYLLAYLLTTYLSVRARGARRVEAFFLRGRQGSSLESRVRRSDLRAGLEQVARSY